MKIKLKVRPRLPAPGTRLNYQGHDFIALGPEQGGLLVIAAESIGEMPFDEDGSADWRRSSLRRWLNTEYLAEMDGRGWLLPYTSDLTADDGTTGFAAAGDLVFLLSDALYRKYRQHIPQQDRLWWTLTPCRSNPSYAHSVRFVDTSGAFSHSIAYISIGVVPCLLLDPRGVGK